MGNEEVIVSIFRKVLRVDPKSPFGEEGNEEVHMSTLSEGDLIRMFDSEDQQFTTEQVRKGCCETGNYVYLVEKVEKFPLSLNVSPVFFRDVGGDVFRLTQITPKVG